MKTLLSLCTHVHLSTSLDYSNFKKTYIYVNSNHGACVPIEKCYHSVDFCSLISRVAVHDSHQVRRRYNSRTFHPTILNAIFFCHHNKHITFIRIYIKPSDSEKSIYVLAVSIQNVSILTFKSHRAVVNFHNFLFIIFFYSVFCQIFYQFQIRKYLLKDVSNFRFF